LRRGGMIGPAGNVRGYQLSTAEGFPGRGISCWYFLSLSSSRPQVLQHSVDSFLIGFVVGRSA
jgi:hypothetical protein